MKAFNLLRKWNPGKLTGVIDYWEFDEIQSPHTTNISLLTGLLGRATYSQSSGAAQPSFLYNGVNKYPGLSFSVDDYMQITGAIPGLFGGHDTPHFSWFTAHVDDIGAVQSMWSIGRTTSNTPFHAARIALSGIFTVSRRGEDTVLKNTTVPGITVVGNPFSIVTRFNGQTEDIWQNRFTWNSSLDANTLGTIDNMLLGALGLGAGISQGCSMRIASHGFGIGAPDDTEMRKLVEYNMGKYQLFDL